MPRKLTEDDLDSLAERLIPILDRTTIQGQKMYHQELDSVEGRTVGFTDKPDTGGGFKSREAEQLVWEIEGSHAMVTNTPAPLRDGSYRIVLSPSKNWVVRSILMSGLDSSTEIVLILAPRI